MVRLLVRSRGTARSRNQEAVGAEPAAASICDQHGAELFALASAMMPEEPAQATVVEVICAAFPPSSMAVPMPEADMRRQLARRVYLHHAHRASNAGRDGHQRTVWALVQHGQMTYDAAADLLGIPAVEVARMLTSTLRQDPGSRDAFTTA